MSVDSYPFDTYSGLLEPKHYKQIGKSLWLFLWCISSTTKDVEKDGVTWGVVRGNQPMKLSELGKVFSVDDKTVSRWLESLEKHDYIKVTRAPYGLIITVKNSKKFQRKRTDKFARTDDFDQTKMSELIGVEQTRMSDLTDKSVRSNKDITGLNKDVDVVDAAKLANVIERYFIHRRGKGFQVSVKDQAEIRQMIQDGIPEDVIKTGIDKSFAEYVPKHKRDEIRSFNYCVPRCYDEWTRIQTEQSITPLVPYGGVALGPRSIRGKSKHQQQLDELDKLIEEEKHREKIGSNGAL
ncbi:hypothetical protein [Paenibacillus gansuensis]|uniref:Uncharacterized protein n=1 Tax=Paenibacillus gansuensis TaxID=306542 RepID=A0ABW5PK76_9BACL